MEAPINRVHKPRLCFTVLSFIRAISAFGVLTALFAALALEVLGSPSVYALVAGVGFAWLWVASFVGWHVRRSKREAALHAEVARLQDVLEATLRKFGAIKDAYQPTMDVKLGHAAPPGPPVVPPEKQCPTMPRPEVVNG